MTRSIIPSDGVSFGGAGDTLSFPAPSDDLSLSRRRFLQLAAAGATVSAMPGWLADAAGASGPGAGAGTASGNGIVVLVILDGGCDGLHVVPPIADGAYHDAREQLAWSDRTALTLDDQRGLHPALSKLKTRYDAGDVAFIDGVGNPQRNLSHFSSMADLHRGGGDQAFTRTGWVGRYLDQTAADPLAAVALGTRVPLLVRGATRSAVTLPWKLDRVPARENWSMPMDEALTAWTGTTTGMGTLADHVADAAATTMSDADALRAAYTTADFSSSLSGELRLCAGLINAGVGSRVFVVRHAPYDAHNGQAVMYDKRLRELDDGIETFFSNLDAGMADDVTMLCVSEFGRRVAENGGGGTDHGSGNTAFAVGKPVLGGFHGTLPSLTSLTADGNLTHEIDQRSLVATVLDRVLGAESSEILGGSFPHVDFLGSPRAPADPRVEDIDLIHVPVVADVLGRPPTPDEADVLRLLRAFFGREPDGATAEATLQARATGASMASIADSLAATPEFDNRYGALSDIDFVEVLHQTLVGRSANQDEQRDLVARLESGALGRSDVVRMLSASAEYRSRFPYSAAPGWSPSGRARKVGVLARSGA